MEAYEVLNDALNRLDNAIWGRAFPTDPAPQREDKLDSMHVSELWDMLDADAQHELILRAMEGEGDFTTAVAEAIKSFRRPSSESDRFHAKLQEVGNAAVCRVMVWADRHEDEIRAAVRKVVQS